jgi:hypothetical protein
MRAPLIVAAVLTVLTGVAHSYLGERYILIRLFRRSDLPNLFGSDVFTRRTLRLAWHLTTIAWWGNAVLLWALAQGSARLGLRVLSGTLFVSAVVTAIGSRGRHLAWPVILLIAVLVWVGSGAA